MGKKKLVSVTESGPSGTADTEGLLRTAAFAEAGYFPGMRELLVLEGQARAAARSAATERLREDLARDAARPLEPREAGC